MLWEPFVEELFTRRNPRGKSLEPVLSLDRALGFPHRSYKTIHVAGTNGKGSVTQKIASALEIEGFKVGLYTSPHLIDVRERIQVNQEMISREDFQRLFARVDGKVEGFFDLITALAFLYFQEQKVDFAVVEVGLGGRFDATNVVVPEVSVITSIGYDHMDILGSTLEEIAREKGGIIKPGVPLITGPSAAPFFPEAIHAPSCPFYDLENQEVARLVLKKLAISETSIAEGLKKRPPCRFEIRDNLIIDVAHNPSGFEKLIEALQMHFPSEEKFHFLVAFSKDKNWKACLDLISPKASSISAVLVKKQRLERPSVLKEYLPLIEIASSLQEALRPDKKNVICGSFYLMDSIQNKEGDLSRLTNW